jgi:hypothetical protein
MDNKKDKIEEPYSPENTPNPPQIIDPNKREETPGNEPVQAKDSRPAEAKANRKKNDQPGEPEKKEKLLSDDAQINDETTI